jgi:hypothetical protein
MDVIDNSDEPKRRDVERVVDEEVGAVSDLLLALRQQGNP